ncbi:MAG TPA: hypothetical protein VFO32_01025 [Sphingomicrobium sp.]|jgi:hypothetical protein|nr:hypothetical protein [Sphingomicrobium sp.]
MKKMLFGAIALAVAAPAFAQAAPEPEHKMECCEKMKAEGKECCCKEMAGKGHSEHDKQRPKGDHSAAHEGHGEHAH